MPFHTDIEEAGVRSVLKNIINGVGRLLDRVLSCCKSAYFLCEPGSSAVGE